LKPRNKEDVGTVRMHEEWGREKWEKEGGYRRMRSQPAVNGKGTESWTMERGRER